MEPGEVLFDSHYTTKQGATVIVKNVPTRFVKDDYGRVYETNSIGVAMRLEELTNRALEQDSSPGTIHELEF